MGRLEVELDNAILLALRETAHATGMTVDEIVADRLRPLLGGRRNLEGMRVSVIVRERVEAGDSDADIAELLSYMPGRIASIRRSLGLKANRRHWN